MQEKREGQHRRKQIIKDPVNPSDFRKFNMVYCCEQCVYFEADRKECNIGFKTEHHRKATQLKSYNLSGKMAFCRFLEID